MGQLHSSITAHDPFLYISPVPQIPKSAKKTTTNTTNTTTTTTSTATPVETLLESLAIAAVPADTTIPSIQTPPHALLRETTDATAPASSFSSSSSPQPFSPSPLLEAGGAIPETPRRGEDADDLDVPESVRKSQTLDRFEHTCSEILPGFLYVSNLTVAQDTAKLQALGITHVVNCCREVVCFQSSGGATHSITYLELALRDGVQEDLLPFFPQVVQFIARSGNRTDDQEKNKKVLIHCHQGVSRSCAFAIAFLMYADQSTFQMAHTVVKTARSICSPNAAFICQLLEWERELQEARDAVESPMVQHFDGLYRLAPHAAYDGSTLVLKRCYHADSRRKISIPRSETPPIEWLWPQGLFVYMDQQGRIAIWVGAACEIANPLGYVFTHLKAMLFVYAGVRVEWTDKRFRVIENTPRDVVPTVDHFGYASEMAWLNRELSLDGCITLGDVIWGDDFDQGSGLLGETIEPKPEMYELIDQTWERMWDYDANDLQSQSVLLLIAAPHSYLWLGYDQRLGTHEDLRQLALHKLPRSSEFSCIIRTEMQNMETDEFWRTFEAGY